MIFSELKTEILLRLSDTQFCERYSEICGSTDYQTLINAGCGNFAWAYQAIITDDLVTEFPELDLNAYGVYTTNVDLINPEGYLGCKNFTIDDEEGPQFAQGLYFIAESNSILNISGTLKYEVYVMGSSHLNLNVADCASCKLYMFNEAIVEIDMNGNASIQIQANNHSQLTMVANDNSKIYIEARGFSSIGYVGYNNSTATIKSFAKSIINYGIIDPATVIIEQNQKSVVTDASP